MHISIVGVILRQICGVQPPCFGLVQRQKRTKTNFHFVFAFAHVPHPTRLYHDSIIMFCIYIYTIVAFTFTYIYIPYADDDWATKPADHDTFGHQIPKPHLIFPGHGLDSIRGIEELLDQVGPDSWDELGASAETSRNGWCQFNFDP